ncbi:hypothetical protein B0G76_0793 [Paraburkholderia sp. BL23I1N1]|nr:hypothetical protein B0G76_0793 [Paraburkholderia sp. BL23I1N1]
MRFGKICDGGQRFTACGHAVPRAFGRILRRSPSLRETTGRREKLSCVTAFGRPVVPLASRVTPLQADPCGDVRV